MEVYQITFENPGTGRRLNRYPADGELLAKAITELVNMGYKIILVRLTEV